MKRILALAALALAGCATTPQTFDAACASYTATLDALTPQVARMTSTQKATLLQVVTAVSPVCSASTPANTQQAAAAVQAGLVQLQQLQAGVKK